VSGSHSTNNRKPRLVAIDITRIYKWLGGLGVAFHKRIKTLTAFGVVVSASPCTTIPYGEKRIITHLKNA